MNTFRAFVLIAALFGTEQASAQWQTPSHSVPLGRGGGALGFRSAAPGSAGLPFISNGASSDPSFQALNLGGPGVNGQLPNANLVNPSTTVNGQTCTLGAACNPDTFSNVHVPAGSVFAVNGLFGSKPWADVTSGLDGCGVAIGDAVTDNTAAIQCYLTYMYANFLGGIVYIPQGNYKITGTLTVKGGTRLVGAGNLATLITGSADFTLMAFDATVTYGGLSDMFLNGYQNASATQPVVTVANNAPVVFRDCHIWGGSAALLTGGVDGYMENCFLSATATTGSSLVSTGANWYHRVKIDTIGFTVANAYVQNTCFTSACENHFTMSDFSGSFSVDSIRINDVNATTVIQGSVMSAPIHILAGKGTSLVGNEFGSATLVANSAGSLVMAGNLGLTSITVSGSASRSCAANAAITC